MPEIIVAAEEQVPAVRDLVREMMDAGGFSGGEITRVVTAAAELTRNMVRWGGGGVLRADWVTEGAREGIALVFEDQGAGIDDLDRAMRDGYSTGDALGLGLPGAARLVDVFQIDTHPGRGTRVEIKQWKR